jgi:hypothetical protein
MGYAQIAGTRQRVTGPESPRPGAVPWRRLGAGHFLARWGTGPTPHGQKLRGYEIGEASSEAIIYRLHPQQVKRW